MKKESKINKTIFLLLAVVMALPAEGSKPSMSQGKHKIIVQKAERIKENLSEVKKATEETTQKVKGLTVKEDEAFTKSEDLDLSERDRLNHLASSINHRADVYIEVRQLAESNGERLAQVEKDLAEIDRALATSPYLTNDPKTLQAVSQVRANLTRSLEVDAKLSELAGRASAHGGISPQTRRMYQISQGQLASAIKATSSKDGKTRGEAFRKQISDLRSSVRSRRTRMAMIEKVTHRSLREIEVFAATQGTRVIFEEIDRSLQGIAPDDDPLGLKVLRPEANDRYWNWATDGAVYDEPKPQAVRAFVPIGQRINLNQL